MNGNLFVKLFTIVPESLHFTFPLLLNGAPDIGQADQLSDAIFYLLVVDLSLASRFFCNWGHNLSKNIVASTTPGWY